MNICGTTGTTVKAFYIFAPHKQIVRELPMIFKDFLRITDALRHKLNPNQTSNEIIRAFLI